MLNRGITKPFITYEDQLKLLEDRGLAIENHEKALSVLKSINYYRLSGYSLSLRRDDHFYPGISFENIYELYMFDELFRSVIMKYAGIVEVSFRSYIAYYHAEKYTPLGYLDQNNFEDISRHSRFLVDLNEEIERSDDYFVSHHKVNLNSVYPFWVAIEVTSFGVLSKLYKNMKIDDRKAIAKNYVGYPRKYVENWLQCCSYCRNIAAHCGRFYNRSLKSCPVRLNPKCYNGISNVSAFAFVIAIYNLLPSDRVKNMFKSDLSDCFIKFPFALPKYMGFPDNWFAVLN
ncbi:MAG: Abi family protein [Lachnospiraceae bacterium]|nr:Abi family protein [Lachnospiraceae bacterium]